MSGDAIHDTTLALKALLEATVAYPPVGNEMPKPITVYVGAPIAADVGTSAASLFLYNVVPNGALRNVERFAPPVSGQRPQDALTRANAIPVDLRYLISVFRAQTPGSTADPAELLILGRIIQSLQAYPTLSGSALQGQVVRVSPEPYAVDELNRIWGMFPTESYRTSVIYVASPVFIEADLPLGPPVQSRTIKPGVSAELPGGLGTGEQAA
jgi:Pvc16 N-terminal domain